MILTVGHSVHSIDEFLNLLLAHGVEQVIDVRTIPKSRRNPQFNQDALAKSLQQANIGYRHMPGLGGLRHAHRDSVNTAWRNASFRGFADYMQTPDFEESLDQLVAAAAEGSTAIMCAEALPWRCHRSLIADALLARGVDVAHIMSATQRKPHSFTPFARVEGSRVTYPDHV